MTFRINLGPCHACNIKSATLEASRVCTECLRVLDRLCTGCASGACHHCNGKLAESKEEVFPYSLFIAIAGEDTERVRELVMRSGQDVNDLRNESGRCPLSVAASTPRISEKSRQSLVNCLLSLGARPDARDHGDRTPLIHASMSRTVTRALAELLCTSVDAQDAMGRTALMYAAKGQHAMNVRAGSIKVAGYLLEIGADAMLRCRRQLTALGHAMLANDRGTNGEMVRYLEKTMLDQAAQRILRQEYQTRFDAEGNLEIVRKSDMVPVPVPLA